MKALCDRLAFQKRRVDVSEVVAIARPRTHNAKTKKHGSPEADGADLATHEREAEPFLQARGETRDLGMSPQEAFKLYCNQDDDATTSI